MSVVYGPDAFTVGGDVPLQTYNGDWVKYSAGGNLEVWAAADGVSAATDTEYILYGWEGVGSPTGDQEIRADFVDPDQGNTDINYAGLMVRGTMGSGGSGYLAYVDFPSAIGNMRLWRMVNGTPTGLATGVSVSFTEGVPLAASFSAVTNGSQVDLTFSLAGHPDLTYSDTDGARLLSGVPGLFAFASAGSSGPGPGATLPYLDNVEIDNAVGGGGGGDEAGPPLVESGLVLGIRRPRRIIRGMF